MSREELNSDWKWKGVQYQEQFDWRRDYKNRQERWEKFQQERAAEQKREWEYTRTSSAGSFDSQSSSTNSQFRSRSSRFKSHRQPQIRPSPPLKFYRTLGVQPNASAEEIRKSWRRLAKKYHPDVHPGQNLERYAGRFKEIVEAFDVLKDPKKRKRYDNGEIVK